MALTITGAVLATLGTQVATISSPIGKGLVWAAAVAVGLVPVIRPRFGRQAVEAWTRARSASETLKEQVYTYLAEVGPYREADRDERLRDQADAILAAVDDLQPNTADIQSIPRPLPAVCDVDGYVAIRVNEQIDGYYRTQVGKLNDRLRLLRGAELTLAATAVVAAATAGSLGVNGAATWVPVITTVSAALAAHVAAARYEFLLIEYARTAAQLERLRDRRHQPADPVQTAQVDDEFVAQCERIISAQNEAWMAKLSSDPG